MKDIESIITQLEAQKLALENALAALRGINGEGTAIKKQRGRPKGSGKAAKKSAANGEGRLRQIEAMRRYWASKKAGTKKRASKKTSKKA